MQILGVNKDEIWTGQTGLDKFVKLQIGLHHCVDLIETIEMHI